VYAKDGSNVTQGAQADAAYTDGTGAASGTSMGLFKGIFVKLAAIATAIVSVLKVKGDFSEQASLTAGSLNADLVPATDVSAYKSAILMLSGAWVGTLTVQGSNDNFNNETFTIACVRLDGVGPIAGTFTSNVPIYIPIACRYLRVRMTSYTSGAANGVLEQYTFPLNVFPGVQAVSQSGTWTVQPGNTANTTAWLVNQATSATGTKTSVASSASSVTILASNASRKGAMVYNDSTQVLYLDLSGGTASNASYSVQIQPNGFFELPAPAIYSGLITGIWAAANGNARVTEFS